MKIQPEVLCPSLSAPGGPDSPGLASRGDWVASAAPAIASGGRLLPPGWRRLSAGCRGARLYAIVLAGGGTYWLVVVTRQGANLSRRFASELHARAWLKALLGPEDGPSSFDWEEMNGSLRASWCIGQSAGAPAGGRLFGPAPGQGLPRFP